MNDEPVVFSQAVEGLVRAMNHRLDESAKIKLAAHGLDVRVRLRPAYPLSVWAEVVRIGGALVAPGESHDAQMYELGRRFVEGYRETIVGKAMLAALKVLGPRRTLERMSRNFRSGNNYTQTTLEPRGPTAFTLWLNRVNEPEFYRGLLTAGLDHSGAAAVVVKLRACDSNGAHFDIEWT